MRKECPDFLKARMREAVHALPDCDIRWIPPRPEIALTNGTVIRVERYCIYGCLYFYAASSPVEGILYVVGFER